MIVRAPRRAAVGIDATSSTCSPPVRKHLCGRGRSFSGLAKRPLGLDKKPGAASIVYGAELS